MPDLTAAIGSLLRNKGLTLGTVESATGGLIAHLITNVPGSSDYYLGSVVSYSNEVKIGLIGVRAETIIRYGAVSSQTAEEMAEGGRRLLKVDICIADTGIAGPTGASLHKPIGLFYFGLAHHNGCYHRKYLFSGSRQENKHMAAGAALSWLQEFLEGLQ